MLAPEPAGAIISERLQDVYLTGGWPIAVVLFFREHPDGGPQPITSRHLRLDLKAAIRHAESSFRRKLGSHDRIQVHTIILGALRVRQAGVPVAESAIGATVRAFAILTR